MSPDRSRTRRSSRWISSTPARTLSGLEVVRADSSASYGDETVRWRLKPDSLLLALGGEWVSYRLKLAKKGKRLTLSGGDLTEPLREMTIASTIPDMLAAVTAVGDDLRFFSSTGSPTILIGEMTVAGT